MTRPTPKTGEIYRHFKGSFYKIICVGKNSETNEKMVVYVPCKKEQIIDPEMDLDRIKKIWRTIYVTPEGTELCVSSLDKFMSEVDHNEYPNASQKFRFKRYTVEEGSDAIERIYRSLTGDCSVI